MNYKNIALLSIFLSTSCFASEIELESLDFLQESSVNTKIIKKNTGGLNANDMNLDLSQLEKKISNPVKKEISSSTDTIDYLKKVIRTLDPKYANADIYKMKELSDFYEIDKDGEILYIHKSGNYLLPVVAKIVGTSYEDLQISKKKEKTAKYLKEFPKSNLISYMATNPTNDIYVFSDYTCPFCKKFHKNLLEINNLGINVHYIPFPRNGVRDVRAVNGLKNIICSDVPSLEFNRAFIESADYHKKISPLSFNCKAGKESLHNAMILGDKVKVKGTPYIFLSNGAYLGGWTGIRNFNSLLSKEIQKSK